MNHTKKITFKAFTLAEVLITLGIIGVVAALTIPQLMNKTNNLELKSMLKEDYRILNEAVKIELNNRCGSQDMVCFFQQVPNSNALSGLSALSLTKQCPSGAGDCFHSSTSNTTVLGLTGRALATSTFDTNPSAVLPNGSLISYTGNSSTCGWNSGATVPPINQGVCGIIWIDVNGFKLPNTLGIDIFEFVLISSGLVPDTQGGIFGGDFCNASLWNGWNGRQCTAKALMDVSYP